MNSFPESETARWARSCHTYIKYTQDSGQAVQQGSPLLLHRAKTSEEKFEKCFIVQRQKECFKTSKPLFLFSCKIGFCCSRIFSTWVSDSHCCVINSGRSQSPWAFTCSRDQEKQMQTLPRCFCTRPWGARTPRLCSSCRWSTMAGGWTPRWRGPPGASAGSQPGWRSERPCDRTRLPSPRRSATLMVEKNRNVFTLANKYPESQRDNTGFLTYALRCTRRRPPTSQQLQSSLFLPPCSKTDMLIST